MASMPASLTKTARREAPVNPGGTATPNRPGCKDEQVRATRASSSVAGAWLAVASGILRFRFWR